MLSRSLALISGTSGLWSVSSLNSVRPQRNLSHFSHAHTLAKHSFSICAHRCSAGVNILEQNATGFIVSHHDLAYAHLRCRMNWHRHSHMLTLSRRSTPETHRCYQHLHLDKSFVLSMSPCPNCVIFQKIIQRTSDVM